jgi:hypothetical protein
MNRLYNFRFPSASALSAAPNPNRNPMLMNIPSQFPYRATVGLDWADQKHDVFVRFANGDSYRRTIDSRPEAIQEWLLELRSTCGQGKIAIALEQRRGALFYQ